MAALTESLGRWFVRQLIQLNKLTLLAGETGSTSRTTTSHHKR